MTKTLSIVVPVYYNQDSLLPLYRELQHVESELSMRSVTMELIFVDDGSGDGSLEQLLRIKHERKATRVIKLSRNFGAIHALKLGISFVTGDCFIALSADLQDPPELILNMVDKWLAGSKYIICVRKKREDPFLSIIFAKLYYLIVKLFVDKNYPKGGFDLMLIDKIALQYIKDSSKNINTSLLIHWLGFKPEVIEYIRKKRQHGKSRWTFLKKLKYFIDSILSFSVLPIRLMSLFGIGVSTISFIYGLFIIINAFLGHVDVRGFATLVSLISFLLGIIIFMLGIIGEYIWRIFDEVNRRPEVVIEEIF